MTFETILLPKFFIAVLLVAALTWFNVASSEVMFMEVHGNAVIVGNPYKENANLSFHVNGLKLLGFSTIPDEIDTFSLDNTGRNNFTINVRQEHHYAIYKFNFKEDWSRAPAEVCIHYGSARWYAMFDEDVQTWPNAVDEIEDKDYKDFQLGSLAKTVLEDSLLNSEGMLVSFLQQPYQVKRGRMEGRPASFCIRPIARYFEHHLVHEFNFEVMMAANVLDVYRAHLNASSTLRPEGIPDERMFRAPIWSTWAEYKTGIDTNKVIEYADKITSHGFPNSQIEVDDKWEVNYGDLSFDKAKFPDPKAMVDQLHAKGYRVTLWAYPFVNKESPAFNEYQKYFVKDEKNQTIIASWWNGQGALYDFRDEQAADWFVERIETIRNSTGIESFKFDAGEASYYNADRRIDGGHLENSVNEMTTAYVRTCARLGNMIETRVAYRNQDLPIFIRMLDKNSDWSYAKGLKSLIPSALTMSLAGYSFVMPDMIGGNAYGNRPSDELFIRWLQANTFMPTMQFSLAPWTFGEKAINLTIKFIELHAQYAPKIIELAHQRTKTGEPIMRPMWYVSPEDEATFDIGDQFLLGDDLLVAPVVVENATSRHVYFPAGDWVEQNTLKVYKGPGNFEIPAPLENLPYFIKNK